MELALFDMHVELAAEAFDGIAYQSQAVERFLRRGNYAAAGEAYERIVAIFREYAAPGMKAIAAAHDPVTAEAAAEWRGEREQAAPRQGRLRNVARS